MAAVGYHGRRDPVPGISGSGRQVNHWLQLLVVDRRQFCVVECKIGDC